LVRDIDLRLFPVGRLDLDTEGALLMTNDGDLAQQLLHPKFEINKTYQVVVQGRIMPSAIRTLEQGVDLDGRMTWPARVTLEAQSERTSTLTIIIHEGRKRQVRRMCEAVGHPVIHLKRVAYGNLDLGTLVPGKFRILGAKDLKRLFAPPVNAK
jgi:23S rRNA pseudouridine2605 synthase